MPKRELSADDLDVIDGDTINASKKTAALGILFGFAFAVITLMMCGGGVAGILAGAGVLQDKKGNSPILLYSLGGGSTLIALCFVPITALFFYRGISILIFGERLIIGADALQWLRGSTIQMHLPFDNVEEIAFEKTQTEGVGEPARLEIVGIRVDDVKRSDTRIDRKLVKQNREKYGFDVVITDMYEIPLKDFHRKLRKRWRAASRAP